MLYIKELSHRSYLKTCIFLFCSLCSMSAKAEYKPMLKDGRIWNLIEVYHECVTVDPDGNIVDLSDENFEYNPAIEYGDSVIIDTVKVTYIINGTEIVDNRLCYKLYVNNNRSCGYYYEEDGKVYAWRNGEWEQGFDFSLEEGETCPLLSRLKICSVDTICVGGEYYRRLWYGLSDDEYRYYWIEGVGSTHDGPYFSKGPITIPGDLRSWGLMSVYDGETCIFERKDFFQPGISTSVEPVPSASSDTKPVVRYNLQGRRLTQQPRKGVYIQDGRKIVVK